MKILCNDRFGLNQALLVSGHTDNDIKIAISKLKGYFRDACETIFAQVKQQPLPECIEIRLAQTDTKSNVGIVLAAFLPDNSTPDRLTFIVYEELMEIILKTEAIPNKEDLHMHEKAVPRCITHEMCHAADMWSLKAAIPIIRELYGQAYRWRSSQFVDESQWYDADTLKAAVRILDTYRAEGIAVLGERLINKIPFTLDEINRDTKLFKERLFPYILELSQDSFNGSLAKFVSIKINREAYNCTPSLILQILRWQGTIHDTLWHKLTSGSTDLTLQELSTILNGAFLLSLPGYIGKLMMISRESEENPTLDSLIEFCNSIDYTRKTSLADDGAKCLIRLASEKHPSAKDFNEAIREIMGMKMSDEEIEESLSGRLPTDTSVDTLMDALRSHPRGTEKGDVARWALTYLFDDEDIIADDLPILGLVDDKIVISIAVSLLSQAD